MFHNGDGSLCSLTQWGRFSVLADRPSRNTDNRPLVFPTDPKKDGFVNCYAHPAFASDADFNAYMDKLRRHALRTADVDVRPGDALLTLTTCLDDDRLVIVARKLRSNETDY